jgi:hypothetical protein
MKTMVNGFCTLAGEPFSLFSFKAFLLIVRLMGVHLQKADTIFGFFAVVEET